MSLRKKIEKMMNWNDKEYWKLRELSILSSTSLSIKEWENRIDGQVNTYFPRLSNLKEVGFRHDRVMLQHLDLNRMEWV